MRAPSIQVPAPDEEVLGEVTLAPYGLTGVSEAQLARKLARPPAGRSRSKAETSKLLRRLFPDSPLSMRLAGLAALVRR